MPIAPSLPLSDLVDRVRAVLPPGLPFFVVGGAVRDMLLSRPTHDLDFVLSGDVLPIARRAANALGAAFYPLDEERDTARVILMQADGSRQVLDFAALRGEDLDSDLRARDFTINAMAIPVDSPQRLVDPLGGAIDLRAGRLRACSETSFQDDPLRILRGVRLALAFDLNIVPETRKQMRQAVHLLPRVSPERVRDELFRILDGSKASAALRSLDLLGALPFILPELVNTQGVIQSPPHVSDIWNHSLEAVQKLGSVLEVLGPRHDPEVAANWALGFVSVRLGRYREQIFAHLQSRLNPERSMRALLLFAALYHDTGKPGTRQVDEEGRIRFFGHELTGKKIIDQRAHHLRLSKDEIDRLKTIVHHHLRPFLLAQTGEPPSRRAIYRFYRDTGPAGVDICLLTLADVLATYGPALPKEAWINHIEVVRVLLDAWWERPEESVAPKALLNGHDLIEVLNLEPGPQIGQLLEAVREAQAMGSVHTREEAFLFVQKHLHQMKGKSPEG